MVYKLEIGMMIDYVRKDERHTFIIKSLPQDIGDKILVIDVETNKKKKLTRDILKYCERHKEEKKKKDSALKVAIKILKKEFRPIHIDELIKLIFNEGYNLPRGGQTFKNTLSTSLNNECAKMKSKIKKIAPAIYADILFEEK